MKATNIEIAKAGLCSETAVRGAIERGRVDPESLESVLGFVMAMRFKSLGIGGVDELASADPIERLMESGTLKTGNSLKPPSVKAVGGGDNLNPEIQTSDPDLIMVPDHSNDEVFYENGPYASGSG